MIKKNIPASLTLLRKKASAKLVIGSILSNTQNKGS